jgi:DNA-nicking Smr family endonuclease
MGFIVGEKVGFLFEKGEATITEILSKNQYKIIDELGFSQVRLESDLIKIHGSEYSINKIEDKEIKNQINKTKKSISHSNKKKIDKWEIDLHIHKLTDSYQHLSNTEILLKQLQKYKTTFLQAKNNRIKILVVIHGVGEGVLKNEIRMHLAKIENIKFYDANFLEYGKGATEILFSH